MTEVWKSNPRRFCDFCKCWLSASKPATEFHERGKNHQENVKRRLAEIKKKSIDKRQDEEESKSMFEQMERDALAAVQKDIASNSSSIGRFDMKNVQKAKEDENPTYPWKAIDAQGHTYYYNSLTGESTWEKPAIFEEVERKKKSELPRTGPPPPPVERRKPLTGGNCQPISNTQQFNLQPSEASPVVIETLGEVKDEHPLYGGWQTVTRTYVDSSPVVEDSTSSTAITSGRDRTSTDTEATTDDSTSKPVVEPPQDDQAPVTERKTFKQKVLKSSLETTSSDGGEVTFKKRKFGAGKSTRKRTTDDGDD